MPKETVERCLNIDILDLQRGDLLKIAAGVPSEIQWATHGKAYSTVGYVLEKHDGIPTSMRLQYTTRGDQRNCDYWVSITSTIATTAVFDCGSCALAGRTASAAGAGAGSCI